MPGGTRLLAGLLAGAACLLLAMAAGAATAAAVRYEHADAVHRPVVLAGTTYTVGLALLVAAGVLGAGRARGGVR
ncbi:hypothetical protein OG618_08355 [Kitasatospora sp. NBC_01246]|uniref:hypothetical protein n=1 Tax=Kitasatospora sp. NBC_01246 TaxID=2903570 RepID=UPI002E36DC98|nr:hypothetical protein [Kitasatospora sp. NBC_01246]